MRRGQGGPTLHDVARLASVSHQTVSRVVNADPAVRPETRQRVQQAIAELGYRRNRAAHTLVTRRSRSIGVLAPEVAQHGATSTVRAVETAARRAGYLALATTAALDAGSSLDAIGRLLEQGVEGLAVVAPHREVVDALSGLHLELPVVALQSVAVGELEWVGVDQAHGARLVAEHLLGLGHRSIGLVTGPAGYLESEARRQGWGQALSARGLVPAWEWAGDWSAASGHAAAPRLPAGVTAVCCANDQTAMGLLAGLHAAGRSVPGDVSVAGFDDLAESAFTLPGLTTVHQDLDRVGRRAVEVLLARLEDAPEPSSRVLEPELVVRGSTGPAPGRQSA